MKALSFEEKICGWIRSHSFYIGCIIATALALLIRLNALDFKSPDMEVFLLPWYDEIVDGGGGICTKSKSRKLWYSLSNIDCIDVIFAIESHARI